VLNGFEEQCIVSHCTTHIDLLCILHHTQKTIQLRHRKEAKSNLEEKNRKEEKSRLEEKNRLEEKSRKEEKHMLEEKHK